MKRKLWLVFFILVAGIFACSKGIVDLPFIGFQSPDYFPAPAYHFSTNPVTQEGFELGRKLFYDPILSANNTISCGSCHIQTSSFTHHGHSVSHGIHDSLGTRNTPPIMNLAWNNTFMWDGRIIDLDLQPIAPITSRVEMGNTMENVINSLQNSPTYPALFKGAFGTEEITSANFLKALSQFMVMCVSNNSKYDSVKRHQASFTPTEQQGYLVYQQKCSSCHTEPLFTDNTFRNNGLPPSMINDVGRYLITLEEEDKYKFKVPSLRNLDFTPPYMHDGRFFDLGAVLDHYTNHVQQSPTLDPLLQNGILLSADEKTNLLQFLKTLNDKTFITDRRFSEQ